MALLVGPVLLPIGQQVSMTGESGLPAAYEAPVSRLRAAGAVVGVGSPPLQHPDLGVAGLALNVDGATVQAFAFADAPAAEAAAAQLGAESGRLYLSDRVLFIYPGQDPGTLATLTEAFGPEIAE